MSSIKIDKFIQTSPSEVYRYFTNSTAMRNWMCEVATSNAHPGGHIYLCWPGDYYTSGEFLQLEPEKFVSFTWLGRGEPRQTKVEVSLKKKKDGTLVKLTHKGLGKGKKWEPIEETYRKEWTSSLDNLASVLETGADLRITRRPMMGIYIDEFNPEIAARLCVPVKFGVRLSGTVNGMGAQKVGLQKDDVIVAMDGRDLTQDVPIGNILASKHAGNTVEVTFYRGPEKRVVKMLLSGRYIPPMPTSGAELARQVEPTYHKYESEFETLINNATEDECAHKPAPAEWSVNEILAHLIHDEIGWQNYASEIIAGHEASYDDYAGNLQARIEATTAAFPTKGALLQELKHHDAETLAMLTLVPEDFMSHKGQCWKLTFQASQKEAHLQDHLEQMQAAIQSAHKK